MNSLYILLGGIIWLGLGYFVYGNFIKRKIVKANDANITPSMEYNDGKDYVPTNPAILFGHHFSSIAGAGPIIGPIIAFSLFGWGPTLIWVLVGSVFIGAVHDYTALMISIRHDGTSIIDVSDKVISPKSKAIFGVFVWITLTLVQSVFADLTAKTFVEKPEIVIPTFGLILLAVLFGIAVNKLKLNWILMTVIALIFVFAFITIGDYYPIYGSYNLWLFLIMVYCFAAAVLPVWILLQPRDYLSMYILFLGLGLGVLGIVLLQPTLNAPVFTKFNSDSGPLLPVLFITVACGAVSGFHSLVASGTTAKQIKKESDAKKIAFGGMIMEGMLASVVIVMIASVLIWDDGTFSGVRNFVFQDLMGKSANVVFGTAFGITTEQIFNFFLTKIPFLANLQTTALSFATGFGILILNAFILTSLDTSTRLNRYVMQETLGKSRGGIFKNRYFTTAASVILAYLLCLLNGYKILWPLFGSANQLIAALTLMIVTLYIMGYKAPRWYTLIPGLFMLLVTEVSLIYNTVFQYLPNKDYHLAIVSVILSVLGIMVAYDSFKQSRDRRLIYELGKTTKQ